MMRCSTVDSLLDKYVDGKLEADTVKEMATHVASCDACSRSLAQAVGLASALASAPDGAAPAGFRARVMSEVHHLAMEGYPSRAGAADREAQRGRFYRRLGLSFMLSAALLAVSLVIPPASYPTILATGAVAADLSAAGTPKVRAALTGADRLVRGTLAKPGGLSSGSDGGVAR